MTRTIVIAFVALLLVQVARSQDSIPHLRATGDSTELVVSGEPFLVLGGELGNSSASRAAYLAPVWSRLQALNVNTVLAPVYWELIEPEEGRFDFSSLDMLIDEARAHDLKLVLLWFATWKNSMSTYVPAWVKLDAGRFPRARDDAGISQDILTPFGRETLRADAKAFAALMRHVESRDRGQQTVIMVQVENEIGMLPSARDHHPLANAAYDSDVPAELITYMQANRERLVPEFAALWSDRGSPVGGSWETVFGAGTQTGEIFIAWHFARFANEVAAAGKAVYPLPMFVNAALNRPGREPGSGYPSGGPLPHLMDVWKAAGDSIDFLSPDFYTPRFRHWNDLYTRQGAPLFIPEHRFDDSAAAKAAFAIGHYEALGFAPFSIETGASEVNESLRRMYELLQQLAPTLAKNRGQDRIDGVLFDKDNPEIRLQLGRYILTCRHDYTLGWSPDAADSPWPAAGAVIVRTDDNRFYIAGTGVVVTFESVDAANRVGLLEVDEGDFRDGQWQPGRRLNGDQTHQGRHVRIPMHDYAVQAFELFTYR